MNKNSYSFTLKFFAFLSEVYFIAMIILLGTTYAFNYFWLVLSIFLFLNALFIDKLKSLPRAIKVGAKIFTALGLSLFLLTEVLIIYKAVNILPNKEADYMIILGAKVDGTKPSKRLQDRLDAAVPYLITYSNTRIIVSGGKGADEEISEALAMKEALISEGVQEDRIILEDKSTSTNENFLYSKSFIDDISSSIIIVTSDYHSLRASLVAKSYGFKNISTITAKSDLLLAPNFFTREFLALIKDSINIIF